MERNFFRWGMLASVAVVAGVAMAGQARAGVIVGGSALLDSASLAQLEGWLGEGELTLTNIFTKIPGATAVDFHAAADGQGRTFVVLRATHHGVTRIVGGYNPQSWNSSSGYNTTPDLADRTAFLFNIEDDTKLLQRTDIYGQNQTYNMGVYGPIFGGGSDLLVASNLSLGDSRLLSYGGSSIEGLSLVSGQPHEGQNVIIAEFEVFTIAPSPTAAPEPATLALFGAGLLGLAAARRRVPAISGLR